MQELFHLKKLLKWGSKDVLFKVFILSLVFTFPFIIHWHLKCTLSLQGLSHYFTTTTLLQPYSLINFLNSWIDKSLTKKTAPLRFLQSEFTATLLYCFKSDCGGSYYYLNSVSRLYLFAATTDNHSPHQRWQNCDFLLLFPSDHHYYLPGKRDPLLCGNGSEAG